MQVQPVLRTITTLVFHLATAMTALADPPPGPRDMPGDVKGEVKARWVAPYVSVTTRSVGAGRLTAVQWLASDGRTRREAAGSSLTVQPGFVYATGEGDAGTIHAVNADWTIALPKKDGPAGYVTATEDSRTFVHQFHPTDGEIAADVYVGGKLAGTIGPFLQYEGQGVHLGADGSLALLAWKSGAKDAAQVVVAGPDGWERFRADCDGPVMNPVPAPGGSAVLVQPNTGGDARNTFTLYDATGRMASLGVGANAAFMTWLPGTTTAVMQTSIGYDYRWHLIDWQTGKRLWDVPNPNPAPVTWASVSVVPADDYLLIGGLEYLASGGDKDPVRSLYALDVKTGQTVARWLPSPPSGRASDAGRFLWLDGRLFLVTDEAFSEINLKDIAARRNGWR